MDLQKAFDDGWAVVKRHLDEWKAATETAWRPIIFEHVAAAVAALPKAEPGRDGKDAEPVSDLQIAEAVRAYLEANPPPAGADGKDGIDGKDGADGQDGEPGDKGADGADGVGLASALIDHEGHLIVTTTRGAVLGLGKVIGRDGKDGERGDPGRDGLTLADFDTDLSEDGRILTLSLENDDMKVTHELQLPTMIYRGVYKDGGTYLQGDTVTWAGSLWHCEAETTDKPGDGCAAWKLAVRKGRDAKGSV